VELSFIQNMSLFLGCGVEGRLWCYWLRVLCATPIKHRLRTFSNSN